MEFVTMTCEACEGNGECLNELTGLIDACEMCWGEGELTLPVGDNAGTGIVLD